MANRPDAPATPERAQRTSFRCARRRTLDRAVADHGCASAGNGGRRVDVTKLLKPDMTASVSIQVGRHENVLLVPSEAVKQGSRGATVNVLTKKDGKNDIERAFPVKTGSSGWREYGNPRGRERGRYHRPRRFAGPEPPTVRPRLPVRPKQGWRRWQGRRKGRLIA